MNTPVQQFPPLTTALIVVSVLIALASGFGSSIEALRPFLISNYRGAGLPEVASGEVWRLLTPIFLHFGVLHITFNMIWLWQLGGALERRQGWTVLLMLVVAIGVISNVAQFYYGGPAFGGMSGVVYGLLGYFWMQGRYNLRFGLALHKPVVAMMLVWFVVCWLGLVGPIANMAHTVGLILGIAVGYGSAVVSRR